CGQEFGRKFRIVNGERAPEGSHPWLLGLFMGYNFICGGSLITNRYVLSAAHCFEYGAQRYSALMGANDLTDKTKRIARRICRIAIHSNYESVNYHNDIAIAELHEPVDISGKWIRSICLPPSTQQPDDISGRQFTAAGWGSTQNELSKAATRLLEIQITAISDSACENQYRNIIQIDSSIQICAGDPEFNAKDTCQGDSGGPLIHRGSDSRYRVEGITSFGVGCAGEGSPLGGYTRVAPFVDWISMVVNDMKASAKTRPLVLFDDTTQLKNKVATTIRIARTWRTVAGASIANGYAVEFLCETPTGELGGCFSSCQDVEEFRGLLTVRDSDRDRADLCRNGYVCCPLPISSSGQAHNAKFYDDSTEVNSAELNDPVDISGKWIRTICLPLYSSPKYTVCIFVHSLIRFTESPVLPLRLMEIQITGSSNEACREQFSQYLRVDSALQLCAGDMARNERDACQGDSGSPLTHLGPDGRYRVEGITSFGVGCALKGMPLGGYARVHHFVPWIISVLNYMKATTQTCNFVEIDDVG
ncbi:hypothetical protein BIW11_07418, partial [Tropilaelaps mercedesae]